MAAAEAAADVKVADASAGATRRRSVTGRAALAIGIALFVAMWVWILFFARARNPDVFPNRAWAARAEVVCKASRARIDALPSAKEFKNISPKSEALRQRADVADKVTAELRSRLAALRADPAGDEKTAKGLGFWFRDWDVYITDRDAHVAQWRQGVDRPFDESRNEKNQPNSIRLDPFAVSNRMPDCVTPNDFG